MDSAITTTTTAAKNTMDITVFTNRRAEQVKLISLTMTSPHIRISLYSLSVSHSVSASASAA
jgi:hypothetical protein